MSSGEMGVSHALFSLTLAPPFLREEGTEIWAVKAGAGREAEESGRQEGRGPNLGSATD